MDEPVRGFAFGGVLPLVDDDLVLDERLGFEIAVGQSVWIGIAGLEHVGDRVLLMDEEMTTGSQ